MPDAGTTLAEIAIAAFAIDRTVTALLFLLSFLWRDLDPASVQGEARTRAEKSYKVVYFTWACVLALGVWHIGHLSIFRTLNFPLDTMWHRWLDAFITMLVLVAGSDRISAFLKIPDDDKASRSAPDPIQIAGTVTLVNRSSDTAPAHRTTAAP